MHQDITPIAVRPWTLNGISERMIVSHYENNYGGAVRTLNALRSELAGLETGMPGYRIRALKREELIAMGSVALHELYFGNLGGEGNKIPDPVRAMLEEHFGSVARWRREFVETAQSLAGGSGWVLLSYSRRDRRLVNQGAFDHSQAAVDVYCAYGFHVGCNVTKTLRERGFDARYIRGGISAWYAVGGARAMRGE